MMVWNRNENRIDRLFRPEMIAALLLFSPVVDVITGALLLSDRGGGISAAYKGIIVLLCLFRLMLGMPRKGWIWTTVLSGMLLLNLINVALTNGMEALIYDGTLLSKLFTPICLIEVFELFNNRTPDRVSVCTKKVIWFYRVFFPMSLLIPKILGIGYRTYSYGVGYKGFYYAGNDISIVMVVVTIWNVRELMRRPRKREVLLSGLSLISLLLLGTKTAWLMACAIVGLFILKEKKLMLKGISAVGVLAGGTFFFILERQEIHNLIGSLKSFYNRYLLSGGTVLTFLLSGRDRFIKSFFEKVYGEDSIWAFLIGKGAYFQASLVPGDQLIEMDLLDLLIRYGLVSSLLIVGIYVHWFLKYRRGADFGQKLAWYSMCGFSMVAGHVLFSPLANLVLVIVYLDVMCANMATAVTSPRVIGEEEQQKKTG